jgi:PleD family two-component response regulator
MIASSHRRCRGRIGNTTSAKRNAGQQANFRLDETSPHFTSRVELAGGKPIEGSTRGRSGHRPTSIFEERQLKVLIADDDALSLLSLQDALQHWGYQVETAADGNSALGILQRPDAPLLAIVDGMMPGMNGIDVCRRIRETVSVCLLRVGEFANE